ncbi:MAG: hypothetical protein LBS79_03085 [Tannerella sp.]|jgi:hypothetical protein|nr:hypothetical protein [Tannerella sp.]
MRPNEKDRMRELFAVMQDEPLPLHFNENVMFKVRREALWREKRNKCLAFFGYVSGAVAMAAVCVFILYYMDISIEFPAFELPRAETFFRMDFSVINSPSFVISVFIGVSALFLLIMDSTIRRHIEKKHN